MKKTGKYQISKDDKLLKRRGPLGRFFWGVDKVTPCLNGAQNTYVDHWLVGPHSWSTQPC